MNNLQHIRIVTPVYPRPWKPESGRFVANLAEAWSTAGRQIDVVSPTTLSERLKGRRQGTVDVTLSGVTTHLVPTLGTPFSTHMPARLHRALRHRHDRQVTQEMRRRSSADVIYAQFAETGHYAREVAREQGIPYFVALGESGSLLDGPEAHLESRRKVMRDAAGVVCVSPRLRDEALALGGHPDRVTLIPNFPNWSRFSPMDKISCRRRLGLYPDTFIALYVGHYYDRKGAPRLNAALHQMTQPAQAAFLGSGPLVPDFPGVIKTGSVGHEELALWMNAADVLALPTLAEGCCNAIAEALACALPLVTSDIDDVRWQVPDRGVVLVDPTNVGALAQALDHLAANPEQVAAMRADLMPLAQMDRHKNRASEILNWMQHILSQPPE